MSSLPRSDLTLLDAELLDKLGTLMIGLRTDGLLLEVYETARSPNRQAELYAIGRDPELAHYGRTVTGSLPYHSAHQYGLGVDLVFRVNGAWTWEEPAKGQWDRMHVLARHCGLTGLYNKRGELIEMPHLQLPGFHPDKVAPGPNQDDQWLAWLRRRLGGHE